MKWVLFCFMSVTSVWAGWYTSEESIQEAKEEAAHNPLRFCNGAIFKEGFSMEGSAVIVNERWIATAAHVLGSVPAEGAYPLAHNYSFSYQEEAKEPLSIVSSYIFPTQDLAFLKVDGLFPPEHVAPLLPFDEYQQLIEKLKNQPAAADAGQTAFFFGCGDKRGSKILDGRDKKYVEDVHHRTSDSELKTVTKEFGRKSVGRCPISQYFTATKDSSSCFFSWTNSEDRSYSLNSSVLWGDSGGGMFVEQEGKSYLVGVVSKGHVHGRWDQGQRWLGSSFSTFCSPLHEGGTESYLDTVLRVKD